MKFYEALQKVTDGGLPIRRSEWTGAGNRICRVDPATTRGVIGDEDEWYLFKDSMRVRGPFDTPEAAKQWVVHQKTQVELLEARYDRYVKLRAVGSDTALDFAMKPDTNKDYFDSLEARPVPKMFGRRVGHPFLASLVKGTLCVWTPTPEDIFADDWEIA